MKDLYLIIPEKPSETLLNMINAFISGWNTIIIKDEKNIPVLTNKTIVFAVELNNDGINVTLLKILSKICNEGENALYGSTGAVLIHSNNELYTKTMAQNIIFTANQLGCRFPGRPIVEATGSLRNFLTIQKVIKKPLVDVCLDSCIELSQRLKADNPKLIHSPKILVLHASNRKTSNTLMLWDMVKKHLYEYHITEIHIENGTVRDCIGCSYKTCKHYGQQTSCFYGGVMVEEIYPAVLNSDAVVWICPNYNDSITANISAVINRLTALFRKTKFYNKSIFGVIVSGNSGSDAIAKQLISALNINKTFRLPPHFCIMETANDMGAINKIPEVENRALNFSNIIKQEIKA